MHYEPTRAALAQHPIPEWFAGAKFGIFVHWGLYSVPAWAPNSGELSEILASGEWGKWFTQNPYAEWYGNTVRIEGSETQRRHAERYGPDFPYRGFAPMFNQAAEHADLEAWARLFKKVHARYAVLTTKHHDGFTLWPSRHPNPFHPDYHATRDLVGEFSDAIRGQGMTAALYYSGGLDWTFHHPVIMGLEDLKACVPQMDEYVEYANAHWRELVDRYQTKILWNDIAYPKATDLNVLFAEYYNKMPDGVVNNRFTQEFQMGEGNIVSNAHYDFDTPEYASFSEIRTRKWESCRGIGASFGYNTNEGEEQYQSVQALVHNLIDITSKNGNLLLNVGPRADGTIPEIQVERLEGIGRWLDVNGDAIFDTTPWDVAESKTDGGADVRFTRKGDVVNAIVLASPQAGAVEIQGVARGLEGTVRLLGHDGPLSWRQTDRGIAVELPGGQPAAPAYTLAISPAPVWDRS
jgi:alpha-L-fucosidase